MKRIVILGLGLLALALISVFSGMVYAFNPAYIHAPAVVLENNTGTLTIIKLNVTPGNGNVIVNGAAEVANSTIDSAYTAAEYASKYTDFNFSKYNFTYSIEGVNSNVSGPSAGAAMTMLAISVLSDKTLRSDFTMTGTVLSNGEIGPIGGVYDKAQTAKKNKMDFILVPAMQNGSAEDELYYLVQTAFNIPLVQVSNISEAAKFAFSNTPVIDNVTKYNFYTNYSVNALKPGNETCADYCNESLFKGFVDFTFNLTQHQISNLSKMKNFSNVSQQLNTVLNQSIEISNKNYSYTGADFAFLDYLNAYFFSHAYYTKQQGLNALKSIQAECSGITHPALTFNNFDFVLNAELRQAWAEYTINQTITNYNLTAVDSDGVLEDLYAGGEAKAWCSAANFVYSSQNSENMSDITAFDGNLKGIADAILINASTYPGMYLSVAQQAYNDKNYPVAILSADYARAQGTAEASYALNSSQLDSMSNSLLAGKLYGAFATNFADQAEFYMQESSMESNSTLSHDYAYQAYFSALLARDISTSMDTIHNSMHIDQAAILNSRINSVNSNLKNMTNKVNTISDSLAEMEFMMYIITALTAIIAILLVVIIIIFISNKNKKYTEVEVHKPRKR